jgi:acetoin utilization deacetylase AcuC-like enzyme/GNAT superfamily N-acetyltransferase
MFRIRSIHEANLTADRDAVKKVQEILRTQFQLLTEDEIAELPELLRNPLKKNFRTVLLVAGNHAKPVLGFALLMHFPDIGFTYLDFLSAAPGRTGAGIGGALYEQVRNEARAARGAGLFFECLPDDPRLCADMSLLEENKARLRFYERFGARPIIGTRYETPVTENDDCAPMLVFDDLGELHRPSRRVVRNIVRAILERKYSHKCPPDYIDMVTNSFKDDHIHLRPRQYKSRSVTLKPKKNSIPLIFNDKHSIHHVRERGYVEAPVRIKSILSRLDPSGLFIHVKPRRHSRDHINAVHDPDFVKYLEKVSRVVGEKLLYPYVFPVRNAARKPKELPVRAGYYCIDTFTPITQNAFLAARAAVDCGLTGAEYLLDGCKLAYALVRPPGHHAEAGFFGGFCYFNTNAISANLLARHGRVAILDIDYHHGNGQQQIFYARNDVLTVSLHGHPSFAYPYFSGFAEEKGEGDGTGFNKNYPLPEVLEPKTYLAVLDQALRKIRTFNPMFLVLAIGFDTARGDPTGTWNLTADHFESIGRAVAGLNLPTLCVQEGGYKTRTLGKNALALFTGLAALLGDE